MQHRHLNTSNWTAAAIDSLLERGDLPDWRELFAAVAADRELAHLALRIAHAHDVPGASTLAIALVKWSWPDIGNMQAVARE